MGCRACTSVSSQIGNGLRICSIALAYHSLTTTPMLLQTRHLIVLLYTRHLIAWRRFQFAKSRSQSTPFETIWILSSNQSPRLSLPRLGWSGTCLVAIVRPPLPSPWLIGHTAERYLQFHAINCTGKATLPGFFPCQEPAFFEVEKHMERYDCGFLNTGLHTLVFPPWNVINCH